MAAFNGKWALVHGENEEAFFEAVKTPEAHRDILRAIAEGVKASPGAYQEELKVDKAAGKVQRAVWIHGDKKKESGLMDIGKETESQAMDGRTVKGKVTLDSDTKLTIHQKGADFEATITMVVNGDDLTMTQTSGSGVTAITKYKRS